MLGHLSKYEAINVTFSLGVSYSFFGIKTLNCVVKNATSLSITKSNDF